MLKSGITVAIRIGCGEEFYKNHFDQVILVFPKNILNFFNIFFRFEHLDRKLKMEFQIFWGFV